MCVQGFECARRAGFRRFFRPVRTAGARPVQTGNHVHGRRGILARVVDPDEPFIGSEALAGGVLSRHQLRTQYRAIFPNVYIAKRIKPSLEQRVGGA